MSLSLLASCSSLQSILPTGNESTPANRAERFADVELIAADLVNALMQIENKHPINTTIKMLQPKTTFGSALKVVFENAGYGLRMGSGDVAGDTVSYSVEPQQRENEGRHYTYLISVGNVKMKRDYFVQARGVTPSSNLFVIGADPAVIKLNDGIFESQHEPLKQIVADAAQSQGLLPTRVIEPVLPPAPVVLPNSNNKSDPPVVVRAVPKQAPQVLSESLALINLPAPVNSSTTDNGDRFAMVKPRANMYELGRSNYEELLAGFSEVHQEILIFPNDSMILGEGNKRRVRAIARMIERDTDVVSIIGCSHGRSSIKNGNAVLATCRAQRVMQEFLTEGIQESRILEEGCWAPVYYDEVMPRRGVVVTVKREPRNS